MAREKNISYQCCSRWRVGGYKIAVLLGIASSICAFIWRSAEWTAAGESHPKRPKMQTSAGKVLASIFWEMQGVLFINYLEKRKTIYSKYYIALLVHLKEEIAKKTATNEEKSALSPKQFTMSQVDRNDVKIT